MRQMPGRMVWTICNCQMYRVSAVTLISWFDMLTEEAGHFHPNVKTPCYGYTLLMIHPISTKIGS